jgi:hypothetical protein
MARGSNSVQLHPSRQVPAYPMRPRYCCQGNFEAQMQRSKCDRRYVRDHLESVGPRSAVRVGQGVTAQSPP